MPGVFDWCAEVVRIGCRDNMGVQGMDMFPSYVIGVAPKSCVMEVWDVLPDDPWEGQAVTALALPPPISLPVRLAPTSMHNMTKCSVTMCL